MDKTDDALDYLITLRRLLRASNHTNRAIAQRFATSERTVSRWFGGKGLTVSTLAELCKMAGVTLAELLEISVHQNDGRRAMLTLEQEGILASEALLIFLLAHLQRGWTVEELRVEASIPEPRLRRALARLERAELIRCRSDGGVRLLTPKKIVWRPDGPVLTLQSRYLNSTFFPLVAPGAGLSWAMEAVKLSPASIRRIDASVEELLGEIRQMAREESHAATADREWRVMLFARRDASIKPLDHWENRRHTSE